MSKNFKADLSAVADEVPNHLDLDAGALTQRVARGQRRRKVTSGALTVLLVAGIGVGGYAVLDTLNHDSGPAAPLTSEPQILLDRPGVGDYNPVCGADWDPPAPDEDDPFSQHGATLIPGAVTISTLGSEESEALRQWARTSLSPEISGSSDLSVALGLERYSFLTKDSVVVAWWVKKGASNLLPDQSNGAGKSSNLINVPLIDCRTASISNTDTAGEYLKSGQQLPPGDYQLHGYIPGSLVKGEEDVIAHGNIWMEPALVTIPGPDQETTQDTTTVTAPLDRPGVGDYNPVCGAVWDPPAPDENDPFSQHGARLALGDVGIIVPDIRTTDPIIMSATSKFDLEVSGDQDLSIFFGEERYVYLTKDAVVVAIRPEPQGWFLPGYRLPTEQDKSDEPFTAGNWFFLDLIDCNTLSGGTLESRSPVGDPLPAGEYQLHGYVPAELSSGEEILGSGNIWAGPVRVIIPEQPYWPLSDP